MLEEGDSIFKKLIDVKILLSFFLKNIEYIGYVVKSTKSGGRAWGITSLNSALDIE